MKHVLLMCLALFGTIAIAEDFQVKHESGTMVVTPPIDGLRTVVVIVKDKGSDTEAIKDAIKELETKVPKTSKAEVVVEPVAQPAVVQCKVTPTIPATITVEAPATPAPVACSTGRCPASSPVKCVSESAFTGYWRDGAPYVLPNTSKSEVEKAPGFVAWDVDGVPIFKDGQVPIGVSARIQAADGSTPVRVSARVPDAASTCTSCRKVQWRQISEQTWKAEEDK